MELLSIDPFLPTETLPSSPDRIAVLAARARAHLPLNHTEDCNEDARRGLILERFRNGQLRPRTRMEGGKKRKTEHLCSTLESFGKNLRRLRREAGMSKRGLAEQMATAPSIIRLYEKGLVEPGLLRLIELAKILKVDFVELVGTMR